MFVDEHRRTKPTNILFVDEPKMFVCTLCLGGPTPNRLVYKISYKKLIIKLLVISKATAGEKHPQSGSQGACGPKIDPEATPEYKKMEKNSEKTAF